MSIVNRVLSRFSRQRKKIKFQKEVFRQYGEYLTAGRYILAGDVWERSAKPALVSIRKKGSPLKSPLPEDPGPFKKVQFYGGSWSGKTVAMYEGFAASYYDEKHASSITAIESHFSDLKYPKCECLLIDKDHLKTIFRAAPGQSYDDMAHCACVGKAMLTYLEKNDFVVGKKYSCWEEEWRFLNIDPRTLISCVQHGDTVSRNVLWEGDRFEFIDFDCMGHYPLLYDFFTTTVCHFGKEGLKLFLSGEFDKELSSLFQKAGLSFDRETRDRYLAVYYICIHGRWEDSWADPALLLPECPLTAKAVESFPPRFRKEN